MYDRSITMEERSEEPVAKPNKRMGGNGTGDFLLTLLGVKKGLEFHVVLFDGTRELVELDVLHVDGLLG